MNVPQPLLLPPQNGSFICLPSQLDPDAHIINLKKRASDGGKKDQKKAISLTEKNGGKIDIELQLK